MRIPLLGRHTRLSRRELEARMDAISATSAVIEFTPDGQILRANEVFLGLMGYRLEDIVGRHHRIFVPDSIAKSAEYADFWERLGRGENQTGEFERMDHAGNEVWIHGQYNALQRRSGRVFKVVKYASDITARKRAEMRSKEYEAQVNAMGESTACIEFEPNGTILDANGIFLDAMGYGIEEIRGRHHRIFVPEDIAQSEEYRRFWGDLARGVSQRGVFRRQSKDGSLVWVDGRYSALRNGSGEVFKVVKYAYDATEETQRRLAAERIQGELRDCVQSLLGMSEGLTSSASESSVGANSTLEEARAMSDESNSAASAAQEMSAALGVVADSSRELKNRMNEVVASAAESATLMEALQQSNDEIARVSGLIGKIAEQTNLLALNASIEAASSGDAGSGFGVVAAEVKELAREIKLATDRIGAQVEDVTARSGHVGGAIAQINDAIGSADELTGAVAHSVNEQLEAMELITRSVTYSAEGSSSICSSMDGIAQAAEEARQVAEQVRETSSLLSQLSDQV